MKGTYWGWRQHFFQCGNGCRPDEVMSSDRVLDDLGTLAAGSSAQTRATPPPTPDQSSKQPEQITEAQGWQIDADGQVVLAAHPPRIGYNQVQTSAVNCTDVSK